MTPFNGVREELRTLGITIEAVPGEYLVRHAGSKLPPRRALDLHDALTLGRLMAKTPPAPPEAPLGPIGSPRAASRKAKMYRHNRKLSARRAKRVAK